MKNNWHWKKIAVVAFILVAGVLPAVAADEVVVHLRMVGAGGMLFNDDINVGDCVIKDTVGVDHAFSGVGACAVVAAGDQAGFDTEWQDFGFGLFLKRIGSDDTPADFSKTWNFWINGASSDVGLDTYQVKNDDRIYLVFAPWPGMPEPTPEPIPEPTPTPTPSPSPSPTPAATPTPFPTPSPSPNLDLHEHANRALAYLKSQPIGAWEAMAFGADGQRVSLDSLANAALTSATDIERQILGVRAAGGNPRSFAGKNLVQLLQQRFTNNQIGEANLINDDIFGVLALLAAGEPANAPEIAKTIQTILGKQSGDGYWGSIDLTAAAVEALRAYQSRGGSVDVGDAVARARGYLLRSKDQYGGWGENSASTAWGIQALVALGEDVSKEIAALLRYQNTNGGFGWKSSEDVSAFMTAYAVPALLQKPLPILELPIITATAVTVPTPTPVIALTVSPSPRVAGVKSTPSPVVVGTVIDLETTSSFYRPVATTKASPSPTPTISPTVSQQPMPAGFVPLSSTDYRFAFMMFGLANMGVGLTLARLFGKIL